jgi:protein-tyrosine phosphatase
MTNGLPDGLEDCFCGFAHWTVESRDRHRFSEVSFGLDTVPLWVSGDPPDTRAHVAEFTRQAVGLGVELVLDLRDHAPGLSEWDHAQFESSNVEYLRLPIEDASSAFSAASAEFSSWLERLRSLPAVPMLVHCHMGVNRSASAAVALLVLRGFSPAEATTSVLVSRPSAMAIYAPHLLRHLTGPEDAASADRAIRLLRATDQRLGRALEF